MVKGAECKYAHSWESHFLCNPNIRHFQELPSEHRRPQTRSVYHQVKLSYKDRKLGPAKHDELQRLPFPNSPVLIADCNLQMEVSALGTRTHLLRRIFHPQKLDSQVDIIHMYHLHEAFRFWDQYMYQQCRICHRMKLVNTSSLHIFHSLPTFM